MLSRAAVTSGASRPRSLRSFSIESPSGDALATFRELGVSERVAKRIEEAFPHIKEPTACQRGILPALLQRNAKGLYRDVFLRSETGTGKSLGFVLGLLSRPRMTQILDGTKLPKPIRPTNLIIVPHRELAYQYRHWIHKLAPDEGQHAVQLCVRGADPLPTSLIRATGPSSLIRSTSNPFILVATPHALMDLLKEVELHFRDNPDLLSRLPSWVSMTSLNLDTVIMDEVDAMLTVLPQTASKKAQEMRERHPDKIVEILDGIYDFKPLGTVGDAVTKPHPQLVFASATLGAGVRNHVFNKTRWLREPEWQGASLKENDSILRLDYVRDSQPKGTEGTRAPPPASCDIQHSCLVITNQGGETRNIQMKDAGRDDLTATNRKQADSSKGFDALPSDSIIQAISTVLATDVPQMALLVVPSSTPVFKLVETFKELGVDARTVNLSSSAVLTAGPDRFEALENPILLVSTLANARGLDFPSLSHVFALGTKVIKDPSDYTHIAGRVGRLSGVAGGKMITFIEGDELGVNEERVKRIYKKLGIVPRKLEIPEDIIEE